MNIKARDDSKMVLQAVFDEKNIEKFIVKKTNTITENFTKNIAYIFLGKEADYNLNILKTAIKEIIAKASRDYQIDVKSFVTNKIEEKDVVEKFNYEYEFNRADLWNKKNKEKNAKNGTESDKPILELINVNNKNIIKKSKILSEAINWVRNYQIMAPNFLRSTDFANNVKEDFAKYENITIKVLTKKEIEKLKMGLLLSVNAGSGFEPRVVILEYKGNPKSKDKTVLVGKGIMYDTGGMSLKPAQYMLGMKFDMSGSAIVGGVLKAVAELKPKTNIAAIMMLTDNHVSNMASLPDSVWTSMNGKTVEVNNTDAEGRLVLADGITYGIRELKATRIIDVATLTGAISISLGNTFTGAWTTSDKAWKDLEKAAQTSDELVWRMPFHDDFAKNIRKSLVADLKNTDLTRQAGSNSAAMFLKEFTEDKEYIHLDIAGTAYINEMPYAPMVKTLFEIVNE